MRDSIKVKGTWKFTLKDANGNIKQEVEKDNLIVDAGFDFISDVIGLASQPSEMSHMAIGTGVTLPAAGDTTLETELDRNTATYAHTGGTKVFTFDASWAAGDGTGAITEAGLFNAASLGTMLNRVTFSVINKAADDTLDATFTFTMS